MDFQVLLPGNNRVGMLSLSKIDPLDSHLQLPQGIVMCVRQNEPDSVPGIFLSNIALKPSIMNLLMSDLQNLHIRILCTQDDEKDDFFRVTVKIAPVQYKSKDDIYAAIGFKASKSSFDKFVEIAHEKNKIYLTFKASAYLFFFQFNHADGTITSREVELYI